MKNKFIKVVFVQIELNFKTSLWLKWTLIVKTYVFSAVKTLITLKSNGKIGIGSLNKRTAAKKTTSGNTCQLPVQKWRNVGYPVCCRDAVLVLYFIFLLVFLRWRREMFRENHLLTRVTRVCRQHLNPFCVRLLGLLAIFYQIHKI